MAKKRIIVCDICSSEFSPGKNDWAKLKIRNENYCNFDDWEWTKWDKMDLCPDCTANLILTVKRMTKGGKK